MSPVFHTIPHTPGAFDDVAGTGSLLPVRSQQHHSSTRWQSLACSAIMLLNAVSDAPGAARSADGSVGSVSHTPHWLESSFSSSDEFAIPPSRQRGAEKIIHG